MSEYAFKQVDFENPSALFVLEDVLKGLIGGPLLYTSDYQTRFGERAGMAMSVRTSRNAGKGFYDYTK